MDFVFIFLLFLLMLLFSKSLRVTLNKDLSRTPKYEL